jgi:hypothetical protein
MLTKKELTDLLEGVLQPETLEEQTFDRCMQKFGSLFQKADWFKVCSTLCYLIEAQVGFLYHHFDSYSKRRKDWLPSISCTKYITTNKQ